MSSLEHSLSATRVQSVAAHRLERAVVLAIVVVPIVGFAAASVWFWHHQLGPIDVALFAAFYLFTGFGITVGFHRLLTHNSFKAARSVKIALTIAGSMAFQGPAIRWVADHRRHHQFSDRDGDPHSPCHHDHAGFGSWLHGFWYAHIGWFFNPVKSRARHYVPDLLADRDLLWIDRLYPLWLGVSLLLPAVIAFALTGEATKAVSALLFAGFARIFLLQHVTWCVNSVCHLFGSQSHQSNDESRNNWVMGLLALGEGWHNNHHAFPTSAVHGLGRWQVDASYMLIRLLVAVGLASDARRPAEEAKVVANRHTNDDAARVTTEKPS